MNPFTLTHRWKKYLPMKSSPSACTELRWPRGTLHQLNRTAQITHIAYSNHHPLTTPPPFLTQVVRCVVPFDAAWCFDFRLRRATLFHWRTAKWCKLAIARWILIEPFPCASACQCVYAMLCAYTYLHHTCEWIYIYGANGFAP